MLPVLTNMPLLTRLRWSEGAVRRKPGAALGGDVTDAPSDPHSAWLPKRTASKDTANAAPTETNTTPLDDWYTSKTSTFLRWLAFSGRLSERDAASDDVAETDKVSTAYAAASRPGRNTLAALA